MRKLTIIVPVCNEERHLEAAIGRLVNAPCPVEREWIFVDDCSSDGSVRILRSLSARHGFKIIECDVNRGKGSAVIQALKHVTGDYVMIHDADLEYDPKEIPLLLEPLLEDRADVVYGSRFMNGRNRAQSPSFYANRILTTLSNLVSGLKLTDMETCYKIFPSDLVKAMDLKSNRFGIEVELTAYAAMVGVRIVEIPISYAPRSRVEGKKVCWKDGVAALGHVIRFNYLTSRDEAFTDLPERFLR